MKNSYFLKTLSICVCCLLFFTGTALAQWGLDYTPFYMMDTAPGTRIPDEQIAHDVRTLGGLVEVVRGYGTGDGLDDFYRAAHTSGMTVYATAWIGSDQDANRQEVDRLIALIEDNAVDYALVGSEALLRGDVTVDQLNAYIAEVKLVAKDKGIPVGTAETVAMLTLYGGALEGIDFVGIHIHPIWAGFSPNAALGYIKLEYALARLQTRLPVHIVETGYPSPGPADNYTQADVGKLLKDIRDWAKSEALPGLMLLGMRDEAWKILQPGAPSFEGRWGVLNERFEPKDGNEIIFDGIREKAVENQPAGGTHYEGTNTSGSPEVKRRVIHEENVCTCCCCTPAD